jgi:hypothetical protein
MMRPLLVITAALLLVEPAVGGNAWGKQRPKPRTQATIHRRARNRRHPRGLGPGTRREGPFQINPDGTVGPPGLHPPIQAPPEIMKPPSQRH